MKIGRISIIQRTAALTLVLTLLATSIAVGAPAREASATANCTQRVLSWGNWGDRCVAIVQGMLNISQGSGLATAGNFGYYTDRAVRTWQNNHRRQVHWVTGNVGPYTWKSLCANSAQYPGLAAEAGCGGSACTARSFSYGQNSSCIATIQRMISATGIASVPDTGYYGNMTKTAIRALQARFGTTHDQGAVRGATWGVLCNYEPGWSTQAARYQGYRQAAGC